ncbi:MAG TPA: response regulator transcription factor [Myxococcales bacterium]|nr:response regulator transcription factor [Myxococcales bacterium]
MRAGPGHKVLVVEDDEAMRTGLRDGLEFEGFSVSVAGDGEVALKMWEQARPDLLVLDVMLPKVSGVDVCKRIRRAGDRVGIIMLTARGQEIDKVMGLKSGADDYVTKPFSFLELMARVDAVLRRTSKDAEPSETQRFGDLEVNFRQGELKKAGQVVEVSAKELRLLEYFIARRGEIVSREQLLTEVWGQSGDLRTRTVDVHVAKLRKKIEDSPSNPRYLVTVHNLGYKLNA